MSGSTVPPPHIPTLCLSSLPLFLSWPSSTLFLGPHLPPHLHCLALGLWGRQALVVRRIHQAWPS